MNQSIVGFGLSCIALAGAAITTQLRASSEGAAGQTIATAAVAGQYVAARAERDLMAIERYRPSYRFWRHIFTVPDGSVAYGSAVDGRLLATLPVKGDWRRDAMWAEPGLEGVLDGRTLPADFSRRRDATAQWLEVAIGPVVHNPTRGLFLQPNAQRYGAFLSEWAAIYERFGVPAEIGLAQAIVESGLNGTVRSEARAMGFCQWLSGNWNRLKRLAPHPIEGQNQTTQAPYCAAYLSVLATSYGSFIPALSEHHAGGANVGRTLVNGERLGGGDVQDRYFLGSEFARDLRTLSPGTFKDVYGTYGPRSFRYAEMVFGNAATVKAIIASTRQRQIFAMRTTRALELDAITRRTGLSAEEVRRFNPALRLRVPAGATLYLPEPVAAFGRDVTFWHRPPSAAYDSVLYDFVRLDAPTGRWEHPSFDALLRDFQQRFAATRTEEGTIMATVLAYVIEDRRTSRQADIIAAFRSSERILRLFAEARLERNAVRTAGGQR